MKQTAFILILLCASICFGSDIPALKTLTVQINSEPISLDPSLVEDGLGYRVLNPLREGLLKYDQKYKLVLGGAEKYAPLENGKKYRFTLKSLNWNDGKPVIAQDYLYSFEKTLNPKTISKLSDFLFFIKNARAYKKGDLKDFSAVGVHALSEKILEFELESATPVFLHVLTMPVGLPQRSSLNFTNGPFSISQWKRNQSIELERNKFYPEKKGDLEKIKFMILPDDSTAASLFEKGDLDVLTRYPYLEENRLQKYGKLWVFDFFASFYEALNQNNKFFSNRDNRLAVFSSINTTEILKGLLNLDRSASDWLSAFFKNKPENYFSKSSSLKITDELKKTGIKIGFDSGTRNQLIAEMIQKQLREKQGLKTEFITRDWKTYVYELTHSPPDMFRFGWMLPFVDVYAALVPFTSTSPNNYTGWKNAKYDALVEEISKLEPGSPKAFAKARQAERILLAEDAVIRPIFHYNQRVLTSNRVQKFFINGLGQIDFTGLKLNQ